MGSDRIPLNLGANPSQALLALGGTPSTIPDWPPDGVALVVVHTLPAEPEAELIVGRTEAALPRIAPPGQFDLFFHVDQADLVRLQPTLTQESLP